MVNRSLMAFAAMSSTAIAQPEVCDDLLYELGLTPDVLVVAGVTSAEFGLVTTQLTNEVAERQLLVTRRNELAAAKEVLKSCRSDLAESTDQNRDALRLAFDAAKAAYDAAIASYAQSRSELRDGAIGALPPALASDAQKAMDAGVVALPTEYRLLDWPASDLVRLAGVIARQRAGSWISPADQQLVDSANADFNYHRAQVRIQANTVAINQEFASIDCD